MSNNDLVLENRSIKIILSPDSYGLATFIDLRTGQDFIKNQGQPLYCLSVVTDGGKTIELDSSDASRVRCNRAVDGENQQLHLHFERHRGLDINIICTVSIGEESSLSRWRFALKNDSPYSIRAVIYPLVISPIILGESSQDDCFVWGFMGGQMIQDPGKHLSTYRGVNFTRTQYPGIVSTQFQAYYDQNVGLYLATHDGSGSVKLFGAKRSADTFDFSIEHNYDERPGVSYELPYDTVIGIFHGDWYTAADIYREWAVKQSWCAQKLTERDDIPDWLKEPRPWLCFISRGDYERLRGLVWSLSAEWPIGKYWPARKVVPIVRKFSEIFDTPVVVWMEGWEYIGAPGGPVDIFPPYEGAESFREAMNHMRLEGHIPFAYIAGFHWCYKRPMVGYDGRKRFEEEGKPLAAVNERGEVESFRFVNDQKIFAPVCVGTEPTHELYHSNLLELMNLGAVAIQIDQQLGMYTQVCYSDDHDHPRGYGDWMASKMRDFLLKARHLYKDRDLEAAFGYEVPCETWIPLVDYHMHRPYHIRPYGLFSIPLWDYLYHDYTINYGGETMMGLVHPEVDLLKHALVATYGIQNLVGVGQPEWDYEVNPDYPALTLMKNIIRAQRTYARDYLVFGRMSRPTELMVSKQNIDIYKHASFFDSQEDLGSVAIPRVLHSVWEAPSGKMGYVLINWTGEAEEVRLSLEKFESALFITTDGEKRQVSENEVESNYVTLIVEPRNVVLIEQELDSND